MDGLDLRQRRDGNDRRGYRAGDAPAKPAYGGDRLPLWHPGGVTVGHLVLPGDHAGDAAEHAVALHQPGGDGVLYRDRSAKRRLGSLGALASTINILVLDNPMQFQFSQFLDSALGQIVGCFLALMVILIVRDNSRARTGRVLLNQFVSAAVSSLTTNSARRKENHLPALYQQLFLLLNKFPGDVARFRLALTLIIAHQRLRDAPVPVNDDLSAFHRQLRRTADHVISAGSDDKRRRYFTQLLAELDVYQEKLRVWEASPQVTEPVRRLVECCISTSMC